MLDLVREILNRFHHLTRDVFVYFLPGFFLLMYLIWVDWEYGNGVLFHHLYIISSLKYYLLIVAYIIGHLITAVSYLIECFVKLLKNSQNEESNDDVKKEMEIYIANDKLYENYVNRYSDLMYFRYNMKGVMFIIFIFSSYHFLVSIQKIEFLLLITSLILFIGISLLESITEEDLKTRKKSANELIKNFKQNKMPE
jgi:hypothetical protein